MGESRLAQLGPGISRIGCGKGIVVQELEVVVHHSEVLSGRSTWCLYVERVGDIFQFNKVLSQS